VFYKKRFSFFHNQLNDNSVPLAGLGQSPSRNFSIKRRHLVETILKIWPSIWLSILQYSAPKMLYFQLTSLLLFHLKSVTWLLLCLKCYMHIRKIPTTHSIIFYCTFCVRQHTSFNFVRWWTVTGSQMKKIYHGLCKIINKITQKQR